MAEDLGLYRKHLRGWAATLSASSGTIPVYVKEVCEKLGIALQRSDKVPPLKCYLSIDPSNDVPVLVLLSKVGTPGSPFERFCVAHEVGHFLLLRGFKALPQTKSEYWKHEDLCDDFARHLLIPKEAIETNSDSLSTCQTYLEACHDLSSIAKVPWIHAAIRIAEAQSRIHYLRCSWTPNWASFRGKSLVEGKNPQSDENLFIVLSTTLPRRKGQIKQITQRSPLYAPLKHLMDSSLLSRKRVKMEVTTEIRLCKAMQSLFGPREVTAFAEAVPARYFNPKSRMRHVEIRLAVQLPV
jgi:hypothetical protein